jgi:septal ring factor EnvC (AmiA/AmiB activator)
MLRNSTHRYAFYLIFFCFRLAFAGNNLSLERDRLVKNIENIKEILSAVDRDKKASLSYLSNVNNQITVNKDLINSLNREVAATNNSINERIRSINSLKSNIEHLQAEYANITYICAKTLNKIDRAMYIFFSSSWDSLQSLFQRVEYIKQYSQLRKMHFREIGNKITKLEEEKALLQKQNEEKKALLQELHEKKADLQALQLQKKAIVKELSKKITKLRADLKSSDASLKRLDAMIKKSIAKETHKEKKAVMQQTDAVTSSFKSAQGNHIWPVRSGFISCGFGVTQHPIIKNITINNLGIDIQTSKGETIVNIHYGVVKAIVQIPGMSYAIIIKHGDYYTVYARLAEVTVKEGDVVSASKPLGIVASNSDGVSELHFQIWHGGQRVNPCLWLSKK